MVLETVSADTALSQLGDTGDIGREADVASSEGVQGVNGGIAAGASTSLGVGEERCVWLSEEREPCSLSASLHAVPGVSEHVFSPASATTSSLIAPVFNASNAKLESGKEANDKHRKTRKNILPVSSAHLFQQPSESLR